MRIEGKVVGISSYKNRAIVCKTIITKELSVVDVSYQAKPHKSLILLYFSFQIISFSSIYFKWQLDVEFPVIFFLTYIGTWRLIYLVLLMDLSCRWLFDMDSCMTQSLHRCHCFSMTTNVIEIKYLLEFGNPGNVGSGRFIYLFFWGSVQRSMGWRCFLYQWSWLPM